MRMEGVLFRIITEDVNRPELLALVGSFFDGFTMRQGIGYWKGEAEDSITLEVITPDSAKVMDLADKIKLLNKQEAVLVERINNTAWLV